jgi:hypothetical protein
VDIEVSLIDFGILARKIVAEKEAKGLLPRNLRDDVRTGMVKEYRERLESIFNRMVGKELDRLGKAKEFERVLNTNTSVDDIVVYLRRTIPNYATFLHHAITETKKEVRGQHSFLPT